MNKITELSVQ